MLAKERLYKKVLDLQRRDAASAEAFPTTTSDLLMFLCNFIIGLELCYPLTMFMRAVAFFATVYVSKFRDELTQLPFVYGYNQCSFLFVSTIER